MQLQVFAEGQGQNLHLSVSSGDMSGQFRGQHLRIGTSYVHVTVGHDLKCRYGHFPVIHILYLIQEYVALPFFGDVVKDPFVEDGPVINVLIFRHLEIDQEYPVIRDPSSFQLFDELVHESRFTGTPHSSDDFDNSVLILSRFQKGEIVFSQDLHRWTMLLWYLLIAL